MTGRPSPVPRDGLAVEARRRPGLVVVVAFVVTLAGRFTLDRIGVQVPLLADVRVPLFSLLLMSFALELSHAGHRSAGTGTRSLLAVLLLLAYQILSATWAPANAVTGPAVGDLVAVAILVFVYVTLAEWDRDLVVTVTLGCFQATAWIYFLAGAAGLGRAPNGRWAALGGGPNVFVRIMVLGALSSVYFYGRSGRRIVWLTGIPAFLTGALASGSRGGIAALFITALLALPSMMPGLRSRGGFKPVATVVVLIAVTWLVAGDSIGAFIQERFVAATFQQGYASDRNILFKMALDLFLQRPFLGTGVNGFYAVTNLGFGERYVHNLPLAVAAEGGIIGLFLLVNAFYQLRHEFARVPAGQRSPESRAAAYCGIFVGSACLFSGDYYDARLMWIMLVLAAVRPAREVA